VRASHARESLAWAQPSHHSCGRCALWQVLSPAALNLPRLAEFVTIELLRRIHNCVAKYEQAERGGWCTHSALAKVVVNVTGAKPGFKVRKEYEYAGNAMNTAVRNYVQPKSEWSRATNSAKECARRARKAGRDPPDAPRVAAAEQVIFRCDYGCTPRKVCLPDAAAPSGPIHRQEVPWVTHDPHELCARQQGEIAKLKQQPKELPVVKKQLKRVEEAADVSNRACAKAMLQAKEACADAAVQKGKAEAAEQQVKEAKRELREQQKQSAAAVEELQIWCSVARSLEQFRRLARSVYLQKRQLREHKQRQSRCLVRPKRERPICEQPRTAWLGRHGRRRLSWSPNELWAGWIGVSLELPGTRLAMKRC